jgi:ABC-type glycerol-3-phosphate transport system substrate-binding protein
VPVDDIMGDLLKTHGKVNGTVEYLGKINGKWIAVPATAGSQLKGPCSRIDLLKKHAGIDIQAMYPAGAPPKADDWNLDNFLKAAEACHKGGNPFGIGLGTTSDNVDTIGAIFHSFGAVLVDAKGEIVIKNDQVRQALDYYKKLTAFLPPDVAAWDDASNNKFLVSGQGSLIMNPPSAWAVAKRDNPSVAADCWTHPMPKGPKGRFVGQLPQFYGLWSFSKNKSAAKDLLLYISQKEAIAQLVQASFGYDLPSFKTMYDLPTWQTVEPPLGTVYGYPPRGDEQTSIAGSPARSEVGAQIYNQAINTVMVAKFTQGNEKLEDVIKWAENELEGTLRA